MLAAAGSAYAQTQAQLAEKLNEEGKELMFANKYGEASDKFLEAATRVNEPKYYFNLCTSRFQEGKFELAVTACNLVDKNNPSPELHDKNTKLLARIQDEAKTQNITLSSTGGGGGGGEQNLPPEGGDPNQTPDPNGGQTRVGAQPTRTGVVGRPPPALFMPQRPDHHYTWSLGVEGFGGGGQIGQSHAFGSAAGGLRLKADYIVSPRTRVGAELYMQFTQVGQGSMDFGFEQSLEIFDFGVALYKHWCLAAAPRLCFTPLVGAHVSLMSPSGDANSMADDNTQLFNYAAVGGRAEANLSVALGLRYEHVLSIGAGVNVYSPVISSSSDGSATPADLGLDAGGALGYLGIGYTYRFNTPIGARAFITLE